MNHANALAKQTTGAAVPRLSPLEAFVQWVANFLCLITGMKRRKTFPRHWKDHWAGLRELEWCRDQILAFSAQHVLAGGSLNDRTDFQLNMQIPPHYGACPTTPQAMNRRFIAMAQFRLDPGKYIRRHIRRIATREGIKLNADMRRDPLRHAAPATSLGFADGGHSARREGMSSIGEAEGCGARVLHARDGGGLAFSARGPPGIPIRSRLSTVHRLSRSASETAPSHP